MVSAIAKSLISIMRVASETVKDVGHHVFELGSRHGRSEAAGGTAYAIGNTTGAGEIAGSVKAKA